MHELETYQCPYCGAELEWVDCEMCGGASGFDAWEEDPINFSPGDEWVPCEFCKGEGGYLECPNADGKSRYRRRSERQVYHRGIHV